MATNANLRKALDANTKRKADRSPPNKIHVIFDYDAGSRFLDYRMQLILEKNIPCQI